MGDNMLKKNMKWIICVLFFIAFVFFAVMETYYSEHLTRLDYDLYYYVSKLIGDTTTNIVKFITNFGGTVFFIILGVLTLIFVKDKKIKYSIILNLVIISSLNYLLKIIFIRTRPEDIMLIAQGGYSFPSGHTMTATGFYGFITYLLYKSNSKYKWLFISLLSILIILIGASRIYLGVHYVSDVVAGFCFSISYLIIYVTILSRRGIISYNEKRRSKKNG